MSTQLVDRSIKTAISRQRQRAFELGDGCVAEAQAEAETRSMNLGYQPSDEERDLIFEVAYHKVRTLRLRAWRQTHDGEVSSRLLLVAIDALEKFRHRKR